MRRLGVDVIDLYYQHRVDRTVPVEEMWGAMKTLVERGKFRYLGISGASVATTERAQAVRPRFLDEALANNLQRVERLGELVAVPGVSAAQLAIAWVLARVRTS